MTLFQISDRQDFVELELSDSYANQIFTAVTGRTFGGSVEDYRRVIQALNWQLEYIEVKHEMAVFDDCDSLKTWIDSQIGDEEMTERVFCAMETIQCSDGKIRFPRKTLIIKVNKNA